MRMGPPFSGPTSDFFYAHVQTTYVLVSASTGRLGIELRDSRGTLVVDSPGEVVGRGAGVKAVVNGLDRVSAAVTIICTRVWLRPDGGTPPMPTAPAAPAHP
jgi:hypothetical protein